MSQAFTKSKVKGLGVGRRNTRGNQKLYSLLILLFVDQTCAHVCVDHSVVGRHSPS